MESFIFLLFRNMKFRATFLVHWDTANVNFVAAISKDVRSIERYYE